MILDEKNSNSRPESYPKPTETDVQLDNQPEYTEPQPNRTTQNQDTSSEELKQAQERMRDSEKNK